MIKPTLYLETSIIGTYFDFRKQDPERKKITRKFWEKILPKYKAFISEIVIGELNKAEPSYSKEFLKLINKIEPLKITPEVENLANKYTLIEIIPKTKIADALHLALAVVNGIDYLVSWNIRHLVKPTKRRMIMEYNKKLGIHIPVILTPGEFLLEEENA